MERAAELAGDELAGAVINFGLTGDAERSRSDMRHADGAPPDDVPTIVDPKAKEPKAAKPEERPADRQDARWRPNGEEDEEPQPLSANERIFQTVVTVSRTMALLGAMMICPLIALGVILGVPAGAPRVERAVNALIWGLALSALALPLGGWFGMAWHEGSVSSYEQMAMAVDVARAEEKPNFPAAFYGRYLVLPGGSAIGFIIVGLQFSSAVVAKRYYTLCR